MGVKKSVHFTLISKWGNLPFTKAVLKNYDQKTVFIKKYKSHKNLVFWPLLFMGACYKGKFPHF
jgi:hypothetical protein